MGLAIKPIECHGGCLGCYERGVREAGRAPAFDLDAVLRALREQMAADKENKWNVPTLHGGEPLMLPPEAIDAVLGEVAAKYGRSGIQTSGWPLRPEHIDIFLRHKTSVGVSIDGDSAETNAGRWSAPTFNPGKMTLKVLRGMADLRDAGVPLSALCLLRKCNAGDPQLVDDLLRFGRRLRDEFGITSMRFNPVIAFDARAEREEQLDCAQVAAAFRRLAVVSVAEGLEWGPVRDMIKKLSGESAECVFEECDPWHTDSEIPILGDGSVGVCLKVGGAADGTATLRTDERSLARYEALPQVRQEAGGCAGCFWWPYCKGGCPGAGLGGDWRNRSRFCEAYRGTFEFLARLPIFKPAAGSAPCAGKHGDVAHGDSDDPAWRAANPWWKGRHK